MFAETCKPNSAIIRETKSVEFAEMYKNYTGGDFMGHCDLITIEEIEHIICSLKVGKATGRDNISAEHILYAHPVVWSILVCLFNLMWHFAHTPVEFGQGITIPIPKSSFEKKYLNLMILEGLLLIQSFQKYLNIA